MILELDCGNSFIKWRVLDADSANASSEGVVGSDLALIESLVALPGLLLTRCRLVSVRALEETSKLVAVLHEAFGVAVSCAAPAREMAGVRNGYEDFERLGLDRWLAMLGGFKLAHGACLVLDFGTAATADFIAADGEHLGGFICPGMPLMRNQLRTHTRKIRYDDAAAERALERLSPGRTTVEAVERGCTLMLRGFVLTQLELARSYWGDDFTVFLTGGTPIWWQVQCRKPDSFRIWFLSVWRWLVLCPEVIMRWLFLLLLVLNAFYYIWHQQEAPLRAKDVTPLSLYKGGQQDIRLLSESSDAVVRRDRAKAAEAQNTCLYIGGFADQRQAQWVEQRLTSLDIKAKLQLLNTAEASGYWLRVAPESRRLAEDLPFENLAKEFNELKHKIMLCEGVASLE